MSDPFIGEITMFGGNFALRGWAFCNGQLLPIAQNTALFSLLGTTYGGDGRTSFGLPDLRGRTAMHAGSGPGLTNRRLGASGGTTTEVIGPTQLPQHTHDVNALSEAADETDPAGKFPANTGSTKRYDDNVLNSDLAELPSVGSSHSHTNVQPLQGINFIIALVGIFPSRN